MKNQFAWVLVFALLNSGYAIAGSKKNPSKSHASQKKKSKPIADTLTAPLDGVSRGYSKERDGVLKKLKD